jgi:HAD superfamily hydrolase (TIGR01549 family)
MSRDQGFTPDLNCRWRVTEDGYQIEFNGEHWDLQNVAAAVWTGVITGNLCRRLPRTLYPDTTRPRTRSHRIFRNSSMNCVSMASCMKNPSKSGLPPQLVTFDLFDTILRDSDAGAGHQHRKDLLHRIFSDAGVGVFEADAVDQAYREAEKRAAHNAEATGKQPTMSDFVSAIISALGGTCSPETIAAATVELLDTSTIQEIEFAEPVLHQITRASNAGVQLGIVSNNFFHTPEALLGLLQTEGLLRHFNRDAIAFSSVEGVVKPNPELFLRVCTRLEVDPGRVLHVGDSRATDYVGAQAAGLQGLIVDPWAGESAAAILEEAFSWIA